MARKFQKDLYVMKKTRGFIRYLYQRVTERAT